MCAHEHNPPGVSAIGFSSNGSYLATAGFDGRVCVWQMKDYRLLHEYRSTTPVCSLEWIRNGEDSIVIGYQDGNIATLSLTANILSLHGFHAHDYPVDCLANHGKMIATAAQHEVRVWEWHPLGSSYTFLLELCIGLADPPKSAESLSREVLVVNLHWTSWGGHPSVLLVSYQNHGIFMYESVGWAMIHQLRCGDSIARSSLSPDGSSLALYKLTAGIEVRLILDDSVKYSFPKRRAVSSLVPVLFVHGGHAIAVGSTKGEVEIWDVASATHMQTLVHQGEYLACCTTTNMTPAS
ncbi:WD40 repeat-like protein [Polyporus arcularius HHB13444]|uniref:WD40 repeat-like protein n=1 Tax=Polyporus arcularius HHB13444 TaxID=1314778 RepID=A0A5C3NYA7_9APHY|nr:WD40 repeat-like protein [Polyporus arcularius HHB13444]